MSLAALPAEILDAIFAALPPPTLAALARTAPALYPAACTRLYRAVAASSFAHNLAVVPTLAAQPHLARLVRTFAISLDDDARAPQHAAYYAQLAAAVRAMTRLVSLDLNVDAAASWILAPPAPADASASADAEPDTYDRLESFSCAFSLDAPTAAFLARTPELHTLSLAASSPPPTSCASPAALPAHALPHLTAYTGPVQLLPQLLPARALTSLQLFGDLTPADVEVLSALTPSGDGGLAHVTTLSAITSAPPGALIAALARACPRIACLQLITTCTLDSGAPDVTSSLCALPALRTFELSGMHWVLRKRGAPSSATSDFGGSSSRFGGNRTSGAIGKDADAEWVSPPVARRAAAVDVLEQAPDAAFGFAEAFMEWAY